MTTGAPTSSPVVRVVASVVERGGRLLICRRPEGKRHGGRWEFPGGKLEPDESLLEAATRELREELDLEVVALGRALFARQDPGTVFRIEFVEVVVQGEPRALEHDELAWVFPERLVDYRLAPTDLAFARHLVDHEGESEFEEGKG